MWDVRYELWYVRCQIWHVRCQMSDLKYEMMMSDMRYMSDNSRQCHKPTLQSDGQTDENAAELVNFFIIGA